MYNFLFSAGRRSTSVLGYHAAKQPWKSRNDGRLVQNDDDRRDRRRCRGSADTRQPGRKTAAARAGSDSRERQARAAPDICQRATLTRTTESASGLKGRLRDPKTKFLDTKCVLSSSLIRGADRAGFGI